MMKINALICGILFSAGLLQAQDAIPHPVRSSDKDRAAKLVSQMTLDEKIRLISGDKENSFWTAGIPRLGIPAIQTADGPQGIRRKTKSTLYPSGIATAASWNKDLARSIGEGIAQDAKARGAAILLGPGTNIYRSALCGRNFEYYGEDPFLAGDIAVSYIQGMQEQGVIATVKHFACNNQEYNRYSVNVSVDERTLNEIYFPPFKKAVQEGNVAAVMTSYNPLNGAHTPENAWLIKNNLRKWGFEGIVMSDWGSCYDVLAFMLSGIDLEMPDAFASRPEKVKPLIENGVVPMRELDEKCQHILQIYSAFGLLDKDITDHSIPQDSEKNNRRAYEAALEAPVLLKNEGGLLPLKTGSKIVVIGPNADIVPLGGGSGAVTPPDGRGVTLRSGLEQLDGYQVTYLEKVQADILKNADIVVASIGFHRSFEHEGEDRTYQLPEGQDALMAQLLEYNPNVVAVVNSGGEFDATAWLDKVPAVLLAWYDGQCGGRALAEILSGKVSPSGKLPFTFWGTLEKNPASSHYYPEPSPYKGSERFRDPFQFSDYAEGVFLGYRGVEHFGVKPLYPFGYGLSYSTFSYSNLVVKAKKDGFDVRFTITNTGSMEAAEAAQVYVAPKEPSLPRPAHELKGFTKVRLAPGKNSTVTVHLDKDAFAHYDIYSHAWVTDPGSYEIQVAASSEDIRLRADCQHNVPKILIAGDSGCCVYGAESRPQTGWGECLSDALGGGVQISNHAIGGESTKSFIDEGRWAGVRAGIDTGDIVLIHFGANDEKSDEAHATDPYTTYQANLKMMIDDARAKGGVPVLVTSMCRLYYQSNGNPMRTHGDYPAAMKVLGESTHTPVIELEEFTYQWLNGLGSLEAATPYFVRDKRNPAKDDRSHLTGEGAAIVAGMVAKGLKDLGVWKQ